MHLCNSLPAALRVQSLNLFRLQKRKTRRIHRCVYPESRTVDFRLYISIHHARLRINRRLSSHSLSRW